MGEPQPVVHPAHRDHAHRATRPVDQLDLGRQQVLDSVAVDGVGVAAADLHQCDRRVQLRRQVSDAGQQRPSTGGVAELVDVLHAPAAGSPAMLEVANDSSSVSKVSPPSLRIWSRVMAASAASMRLSAKPT